MKNEREIKVILDQIPLGVIFMNCHQKNIRFSNQYFLSLAQGKDEDILDLICRQVGPDSLQRLTGQSRQVEMVKRDGSPMTIDYTIYPVDDELAIILLRDITSSRVYMESKQENQLYDRLSELVAEMAHEIGNPLSGISTSLQVLLQNLSAWPMEKVQDYIERTIDEIARLADFLKKIREVSRESKLNIVPVNLKKVIAKVLVQNQDLLVQKNLTYHNLVDENITVLLDEAAFYQIILNLLNNSLNILVAGQKIRVYVEGIDQFYVKLVYRNNGLPIPEELLERIFSPLFTTRERGQGIGLAISLKLMTRMGGTMKAVPPEDGSGAKFMLYIPYIDRG